MTLVCNLFAGPGAGKSTTAALVFAELKKQGFEVELAHEYAKDLTWEERHKTIRFQPYVTAKQMWRVHRLLGQVDVVITDSPILFATIYQGEGYTQAFEDYVVDAFRSWNNINFFLERSVDKKYSAKGRRQTEQEAIKLDKIVFDMLCRFNVPAQGVAGPPESCKPIVNQILERLYVC